MVYGSKAGRKAVPAAAVKTEAGQRPRFSDVLAIGLSTAVAMWAAGYLCNLPQGSAGAALLPIWLVAAVLGAILTAGGYFAGRYTLRGWTGGLWVGLIAGLVNLLILMSVAGGDQPDSVVPSMPMWTFGSLLLSVVLGIVGAAVGTTRNAAARVQPSWTSVLAQCVGAATLLLLIAGGLVTSHKAGMAVPDWPSSYGYNMFLYPLSKMSGGIYYEHAHRLLGTLVGLLAVVLAIHLQLKRLRPVVKALGWGILLLVIVQGLLGGFRVIEDEYLLGFVHGVLAQLIFGLVAAIVVLTSRAWENAAAPRLSPTAGIDRQATVWVVALLVLQLAVGAWLRHWPGAGQMHVLYLHITLATAVLGLAVFVGSRAWGLYGDLRPVRKSGLGLIHVVVFQIALGVTAFAVGALKADNTSLPVVIFATAHQIVGALLLAWAVRLTLWEHRLLGVGAAEADPPAQNRVRKSG
jgi:cytochrome c oxidase assembly protein subunit 15